jgi:hypothetical protein
MAAAAANEEDIGACTLDQRKLTINKKWRITEKIASGGFGAIYKGTRRCFLPRRQARNSLSLTLAF